MTNLENFEKLCTQIFYLKGEFHFPFDGIQHNKKFLDIVNDVEYNLYVNKMKNLLKLINHDVTKIDEDTEKLWELI
jgi:hypothetical protein